MLLLRMAPAILQQGYDELSLSRSSVQSHQSRAPSAAVASCVRVLAPTPSYVCLDIRTCALQGLAAQPGSGASIDALQAQLASARAAHTQLISELHAAQAEEAAGLERCNRCKDGIEKHTPSARFFDIAALAIACW